MGYETRLAPIPESIISEQVRLSTSGRPIEYERLSPFENVLNLEDLPWREYQSMHIEHIWPAETQKKTAVVMFHGGGGNSGEATSRKKILTACAIAAVYGYHVFIPEYPRGWTNYNPFEAGDDINPDSMVTQGRIFNEPPEAFARQEAAARLSFKHCIKAVNYIADRYSNSVILEGTSFGGAIALQLGLLESDKIRADIVGIVSGFGGINLEELSKIRTDIPLVAAGGAMDPIVPWFQGRYYMREDAVMGAGSRVIVDAIMDSGNQKAKALSICTVDKGHVWGAACPLYGRLTTLNGLSDETLVNYYIAHLDTLRKLMVGEVQPGNDTYSSLDQLNFLRRDVEYEAENFAQREEYWKF